MWIDTNSDLQYNSRIEQIKGLFQTLLLVPVIKEINDPDTEFNDKTKERKLSLCKLTVGAGEMLYSA